MLAKIHVEHVN